jgi:malonate-semialdehyde dehydrogenase (acetylating)/methylmalonate-semialdehyde dehydrogenase
MKSNAELKLVDLPAAPLAARNLIAGEWSNGQAAARPVVSPYTGASIGTIYPASPGDVNRCVEEASKAFATWRAVPIKERTAVLLRLRELLLRDVDALAHSAARESGKLVAEGRAEVLKGIEVLEFAASLQNSDLGGALEVSRGVTCEYRREPLGVTVGITPFNFPTMVPMWMIPISLALGNAFILKPSDKVPFTPVMLGDLIREAGFPNGVFSVLQGGREIVEALAEHPGVSAVGFVGSSAVAKSVYARAAATGKRALCLGGAKNHLIVVPDADPVVTVDGVVASFTGCAGQRCMAASVLIAVGQVDLLIEKIVEAASKVELGRDMGALIDRAAHNRLVKAIERAQAEGASIRLDGRKAAAPKGHEQGFWLGPTIIDHARPTMECGCVELFGPVLTIVRVNNLDEALRLERESPYGNALSVFTTSGAVAQYVSDNAASGMIGINIGVPVPREPFSFGGTKESKFGTGDITGAGGVELWSQRKKITAKWSVQPDKNWMS